MRLRMKGFALIACAAAFTACESGDGTPTAPTSRDGDVSGGSGDGSTGGSGSDGGVNGPGSVDVDESPAGDADTCQVDELVPPEVYTRRAKTVLVGEELTADELGPVLEDPSALKGLLEEWVETELFRSKMLDFFMVTLQQTSRDDSAYAPQITGEDNMMVVDGSFYDAMTESMARTALWIIDEGRPFTEIASTRTWMLTTELMAFLAAADRANLPQVRIYRAPFTEGSITFNANTPLSVQIANATFYSATEFEGVPPTPGRAPCTDPVSFRGDRQHRVFAAFIEGTDQQLCGYAATLTVFNQSDHADWRPVTLIDGTAPRYFNVQALRGATQLALTVPRGGFFSHPAFLATWLTNVDNSFRVTTNQSLIVGLGLAFEDTDVSTPLGDDGLSSDHASPTTACYACHKNLDPMRNFFSLAFDPNSYFPLAANERPDVQPSFSFQGYSANGDTLADLGEIISDHPRFGAGWVQKMCYFAKTKSCDEQDPEFQRVVDVFETSGYDFKTMVVELFSSRLLTGGACIPGDESEQVPPSITRQRHLCQAISARLDTQNPCEMAGPVQNLAAALPADSWGRGSDRPDQPTESSLFYTTTIDALCGRIAPTLVNAQGSPIRGDDPEGSIDALVERLMGIATNDPRYALVHEWLTDHYEDISDLTNNRFSRIESTFVLACSSPFVVSTDF